MQNKLCQDCRKYFPTYEVTHNNNLLYLCDYCFHILKWKNPKEDFMVESHISTKESMQLYHESVKDYLIPQILKLTNREQAQLLLQIEKEKGMDSVMTEVKNNQRLVKGLCIKNNISYPEFIASLRLFVDN